MSHVLIILEVLYINKNLELNENIRSKEIRLTGEESKIMKTEDALRMAREQNLDLVMISPTAVPPVCRIMDYSKYLYEQSKKQKEARQEISQREKSLSAPFFLQKTFQGSRIPCREALYLQKQLRARA